MGFVDLLLLMGIFTPKKKTVEITYIEEKVIVIKGEKWHHNSHELQEIRNALALLIKQNKKIMATQAELAQQLRDIKAQNDKSRQEILAKIQALEDALAAAGNTTPEVDAAVADLKASVQTDDDIVPDTTP